MTEKIQFLIIDSFYTQMAGRDLIPQELTYTKRGHFQHSFKNNHLSAMINTGACKSKHRLLTNLADIYHRHINAWFREKVCQ